ncbi:MAG: hypothetical protein IPO40_24825 [Fibrobacteres bacterium]|nr:hypothetical protein [Fibrobacterota bacterium]
MTPQEWIKDVRESIERDDEPRPLLENLKVGADHLAAALEEIARLRADASTASPSCDRCQSAHCCSVTGSTVPPLCVTDPDGSLPLWMPWTNADVQARVDALHAEINKLRKEKSLIAGAMRADDARLMVAMARVSKTPEDHLGFGCDAPEWMADEILRLRAEAGRVVVPELTPDGMSTAAFVEGYRFAASRAHSVPASRILKDGEVAVDAGELAALRKPFSAAGNTIANIRSGVTIAEINDAWAGVCSA